MGSNIFNIVGILGVTGLIQPINASGLNWFDGGGMLGFAGLTLPLLWSGYTFARWEGSLLLGAYATYVVLLLGTAA